jgi:hydrogenase maturation protease
VKRPLLIGFGNTLRGDDGAGVYAAERVAGESAGADVIVVQELAPELAASLGGRDLVMFVDASTRTREVALREVERAEGDFRRADHTLLPADIVALSRTLFPPGPRTAIMIEIPAFDCGFGERLTPDTERMVDQSVTLICELLAGAPLPPHLPAGSTPG